MSDNLYEENKSPDEDYKQGNKYKAIVQCYHGHAILIL